MTVTAKYQLRLICSFEIWDDLSTEENGSVA